MNQNEKAINLIIELKSALWNLSQYGAERTTHHEVYELMSEADSVIAELRDEQDKSK